MGAAVRPERLLLPERIPPGCWKPNPLQPPLKTIFIAFIFIIVHLNKI